MSKKISELSAASALTGTEVVPVVQNGNTVKTTAQDIADFVGGGVKVYRALLTQTGTAAPVPVILENTIGDIVWTRTSAGVYLGTLANGFPNGKTMCDKTTYFNSAFTGYQGIKNTESIIQLTSFDEGTAADDVLTATNPAEIQILVYP
jgi:hypothetical protein